MQRSVAIDKKHYMQITVYEKQVLMEIFVRFISKLKQIYMKWKQIEKLSVINVKVCSSVGAALSLHIFCLKFINLLCKPFIFNQNV